jgi:hypothetical protein
MAPARGGSRVLREFSCNEEGLIALPVASWNQTINWLSTMDLLRRESLFCVASHG